MKTFTTIHAIAQNDKGEILILQRANHRDRPGKWNCVTGYIQDRESAEQAALRELKEETNLDGNILNTTEPHWIEHDNARWVIIPSLIKVYNTDDISVDKNESQAYKWVRLDDPILENMTSLKASLKKLNIL